MTDRKRATAELLTKLGFEYNGWAFKRYRGSLFEEVFLDDEGYFEYRAAGKLPDLPALLSPLTLEMVEEAVNKTRTEVGSWENAECRVGAFIALDNLMKRLRQQMGGGQG